LITIQDDPDRGRINGRRWEMQGKYWLGERRRRFQISEAIFSSHNLAGDQPLIGADKEVSILQKIKTRPEKIRHLVVQQRRLSGHA